MDKKKLIFIYGGKKLEEYETFENQANSDDKTNKKMNVLVYDIDDYNNSDIDVSKLKKEINDILSIYLEDRKYLENKVDNWKEAILKEIEKIFLKHKNHKTFIHLIIEDNSIIGKNSYLDYGLFSDIDLLFSCELISQKIKATLICVMYRKNIKWTKKDLFKVVSLIEKEFLNLAEGREYETYIKKYRKIFRNKLFNEILCGYKLSLFYLIETSNKYFKSIKCFKIINGEKEDYFLNKLVDSGDIKFYVAFGKAC